MTIEAMKAKKTELGLTSEMIAERSGVPLSTVQKIFSGVTKAPRRLTLIALETVLQEEEERRTNQRAGFPLSEGNVQTGSIFSEGNTQAEMVRETISYGSAAPRKYTIDDYYALPEDQRVELIDGVFYDMGAPALRHQMILGDLHILFRECVKEHDMPCEVFLSPCDVRLDMDNYTMVQPDLLVICRDYDYENAIRYEGAPDLVIEILSPSTRSKDQILKLYKYQNAGVREYWIVDPKFCTVTVHYFEEEEYTPRKYDFDSEIPIGISQGKCRIDFSRVGRR